MTEVSWYSAFWALIPLALNSMTQPCGRALGLPAKYGFALRSNPLLCASDALTVLTSTLYWSIQLRSLMGGARKVARCRFEDPEDEEGPRGREGEAAAAAFRSCSETRFSVPASSFSELCLKP